MFAPPPKLVRLVLYSMDCEKLVEFYFCLGMLFYEKADESDSKSFTYIHGGCHFEIHEVLNESEASRNMSFCLLIDEIDGYLDDIRKLGGKVIKDSWFTETHQHIQLEDPDGNLLELMTEKRYS